MIATGEMSVGEHEHEGELKLGWEFDTMCGAMNENKIKTFALLTGVIFGGAIFAADELEWHEGFDLPLEGRVFADAAPYGRLPERFFGDFPDVYAKNIARNSSGLCLRFSTDASDLTFEWTVREPDIAWCDMSGVVKSGFDVYERSENGVWRHMQTCVPFAGLNRDTTARAATNFTARIAVTPNRPLQINFPAYNTVSRLRIGVRPGTTFKPIPRNGVTKPVVFYGTSITQGCAASRPGLAYPTQIGRDLDVPIVNLGFSGHGRMTDSLLAALVEIDAACYVIDCLPNMNLKLVDERCERFLRTLREKRPDVPVVCIEATRDTPTMRAMNARLGAVCRALSIPVVSREGLLPADGEGTIDGTHFTDRAMLTFSDKVGAAVRRALATPAGTPDLGTRLEVLWDDFIVDTGRTTASRLVHRPELVGVTLVHDAPWEGDGCDFHNLLVDADAQGPLYRLYYLAWAFSDCLVPKEARGRSIAGDSPIRVCVAESRDGVNWTKPNLGLWEFEGSKDNNILMDAKCHGFVWDNFMVFKDDNPACPADERYKAIARTEGQFDETGLGTAKGAGLGCFLSADGIHFRKGWTISRSGAFDSLNIAFWDATRRLYHCYYRHNHRTTTDRFGDPIVRSIHHIVSRDFKTWSKPEPLAFGPDDTGRPVEEYSLYTSVLQPYERAPHLFVGFPSRYVERQRWTATYDRLPGLANRRYRAKFVKSSRYALALTDCIFMMTRDGLTFHREDDAFMRPGAENDFNWVYGDCYPARGLPLLPARRPGADAEFALYAPEGHFSGKPTQLLRYALRQDGFVSRHAPYGGAKVVTRPFVFGGDELQMNFSTSARGGIVVTLEAADGTMLVTDEIVGDKVDRPVDFKNGKVGDFRGKVVTLTFDLRDADLYSFRFAR